MNVESSTTTEILFSRLVAQSIVDSDQDPVRVTPSTLLRVSSGVSRVLSQNISFPFLRSIICSQYQALVQNIIFQFLRSTAASTRL